MHNGTSVKPRETVLVVPGLGLPPSQHDRKVTALLEVEKLIENGMRVRPAVAQVSKTSGFSERSLFNYRKRTNFVPRDRWAEVLERKPKPVVGMTAPCHPAALERFIALCGVKVGISNAYRIVISEAQEKGWGTIPTERTMRRELERLMPRDERYRRRRDARLSDDADVNLSAGRVSLSPPFVR